MYIILYFYTLDFKMDTISLQKCSEFANKIFNNI